MKLLRLPFLAVRAFLRGVLLGCEIVYARDDSRDVASMLTRPESNGPARDEQTVQQVRVDPASFFQSSAANQTPVSAHDAAAESPVGGSASAPTSAGRLDLTPLQIKRAAIAIQWWITGAKCSQKDHADYLDIAAELARYVDSIK